MAAAALGGGGDGPFASALLAACGSGAGSVDSALLRAAAAANGTSGTSGAFSSLDEKISLPESLSLAESASASSTCIDWPRQHSHEVEAGGSRQR